MRGEIKELLFISYLVFALFFNKYLKKAKCSMFGNVLPVFSTEGSRLEEKIKPPTPVLLTTYFSAAMETLKYLIIYSSFLHLPSHSHGQFAIGDTEKK